MLDPYDDSQQFWRVCIFVSLWHIVAAMELTVSSKCYCNTLVQYVDDSTSVRDLCIITSASYNKASMSVHTL